jgi:hypothetical protein
MCPCQPLCRFPSALIRDHANVPHRVLSPAIQLVADAYRPLGIGVVWIQSPVCGHDHDSPIDPAVTSGLPSRTTIRRSDWHVSVSVDTTCDCPDAPLPGAPAPRDTAARSAAIEKGPWPETPRF